MNGRSANIAKLDFAGDRSPSRFAFRAGMVLKAGLACCLAISCGCGNSHSAGAGGDVSILVFGDTAGWIVPCGCAANQSGGLLRRGTLTKTLSQQNMVLVLDVGGAASGESDYQRAKFSAILSGEQAMGVAAHNIGVSEARLGAKGLRQLPNFKSTPWVSANVCDSEGNPLVPPFRVVDAGGHRIGVIGVLDPQLAPPQVRAMDAHQSVTNALQQLNQSSENSLRGTILLAYGNREFIEDLARRFPELDAIVGGPTGQPIVPRKQAGRWIASATNKGKFGVHLRFNGSKNSWSGEILEVGETWSDDTVQLANLKQFYKHLGQHDYLASQTGLVDNNWHSAAELSNVRLHYVGNQSCATCHAADAKHWLTTKHAHAWQTLIDKGANIDPYCQQCHTTGYGQPGGFENLAASSARVNVGCESCHGPGSQHAVQPTRRMPLSAREQCIGCHDRDNSPAFEYATYWARIAHGVKLISTVGVTDSDDKAIADKSQEEVR